MKRAFCPLHRLPLGSAGQILALRATGARRRRLLDLGLIPGARVEALLKSPLGDPTAYGIRGSVIALRAEEAEQILVRPLSFREVAP